MPVVHFTTKLSKIKNSDNQMRIEVFRETKPRKCRMIITFIDAVHTISSYQTRNKTGLFYVRDKKRNNDCNILLFLQISSKITMVYRDNWYPAICERFAPLNACLSSFLIGAYTPETANH